jgi:hypothetical protein
MTAATGVPSPANDDGTVIAIKRGRTVFYSERSGGKPYDNCLICAAMTGLRFMGYDVPDSYDDVIRQAIPLPDPQGTTLEQVFHGVTKLFTPGPTLEHLSEADFLAGLKDIGAKGRHKSVYATIVDTTNLPVHFQRLVGQDYDGLHGLAITAKADVPVPSVYIFDPMGKKAPGTKDDPQTFVPYAGEPIAWTDLTPALYRSANGTDIDVIRFPKNGARVKLAVPPAPPLAPVAQ